MRRRYPFLYADSNQPMRSVHGVFSGRGGRPLEGCRMRKLGLNTTDCMSYYRCESKRIDNEGRVQMSISLMFVHPE